MLNEDCSHFFGSRSEEEMTVEGLKTLIDHYASPQMKCIVFNPNSMRTSYASKVWQSIWDGYDPQAGDDQPFFQGTNVKALPQDTNVKAMRGYPHNTRKLHQKGIDPYAVWIEYTREKGISPWISMRMNDLHYVDNPNSFMHSDLWKQRPDLRRVPYRKMLRWTDAAFDYGKAEVREHHLKLIREYFERYDIDGFELDWMRFGYHFRPGQEEAGRKILTEFMQQVKEFAENISAKRNKKIKIGVRVPSRPMAARHLGMDAVEWAKRKLVDLIVITPFFATIETDMPVELWRELIDDDSIILAGGLEILIRPFPDAQDCFYNTAETVRGTAASLLHRGVDRIYLFNYMDSITTMPDRQQYQEVLNQAGDIETACAHPRRHVITYSDTHPTGQPIPQALPAKCDKDQIAVFRIHIGPKPTTGQSQVILGLGKKGNTDAEKLNVWVNGEKCEFADMPNIPLPPIVHKASAFTIPNDATNDGYNIIEVLGEDGEPYEILWSEIRIEPK